jgi:hypothetical protein
VLTAGVRFSEGARDFSLPHNVQTVQTGSREHPASSRTGTGGTFLGVKWQGREADDSPRNNAEVKVGRAIPPLIRPSSWRGA